MWRSLFFFFWLAVLVALAVWLADWNGHVFLDLPPYDLDLWFIRIAWPGVEIDTSIGVLVMAMLVIALAVALLYRFWSALRRVPGAVGRHGKESRRKRGYKALSQGMTAVAAGDADEARRWANKAESLLDEPPLTLLLSAQAAQLNGDEQAAKRYFEAMLGSDETRFMGLRGLVMQELKAGDKAAALTHLQQAYQMRPKTPWVLTALAEAAQSGGELETAEQAIRLAGKIKALPLAEAEGKRAVLLLQRAEVARAAGQRPQAVKMLRDAHKLAPDLVPATTLLADMLLQVGQRGQAARLLERAWAARPHPDLAALYKRAKAIPDGLKYLPQLRKLVAGAASDRQSLITLAEAALDAELWGEARRYLSEAAGDAPSEKVCRLMARLEEAEHGDSAKARDWLLRAGSAQSDPTWVCGNCGAQAEDWTARCGVCDSFATLAWRAPPRAQSAASAVLVDLSEAGDGAADGKSGNSGASASGKEKAATVEVLPAAAATPASAGGATAPVVETGSGRA